MQMQYIVHKFVKKKMNPILNRIEFKGKTGKFVCFDKELKEEVPIGLERFVILKSTSQITGYNPKCGSIWSNEVESIREEELVVRCKNIGKLCQGVYSELKNTLPKGSKFTTNLYIVASVNNKVGIYILRLIGGALNEWIEFKQKNPDVYKSTILVPNLAKRMNGAIEYLVPVFALRKSTEIEEKTAKTLWGRLREWEKAKI